MPNFSDQKIQSVWNKGLTVEGADPSEWRKGFCNAWINRNQYGEEYDYG